MVGSLPSSSIISQQQPPNGASLNVLSMGVAWCSTDYARVPSAARLTVCIYRERLQYCMPYYDVANHVTVTKMNMIRRNALWLCKNHCCENMASSVPLEYGMKSRAELRSNLGRSRSIPQSCAAVSASLEVSRRSALRSQELRNLIILDGAS